MDLLHFNAIELSRSEALCPGLRSSPRLTLDQQNKMQTNEVFSGIFRTDSATKLGKNLSRANHHTRERVERE